MASATVVKFLLMLYCRSFQNEIVRTYAQDHLFDVVTNSVGLATAVLAVKFYWWIDPSGAILVSKSSNLSILEMSLVTYNTEEILKCLIEKTFLYYGIRLLCTQSAHGQERF